MPRLATCAACAACALAACKKKPAAEPPPPPPPGSADAAVAAPDADLPEPPAPDEATLRAGKRTGLGGPDETPEVATEDLARALLSGAAPWSRVVAPGAGLVELRHVEHADGTPTDRFLGRHCGPAAEEALRRVAAAASAALADAALGYELACDNRGLVGPAPRSALCSIDGPAEYALGHDLVFVPDPTLGLRLVGVTTIDTGAAIDAEMDAFDLELAKPGPPCP